MGKITQAELADLRRAKQLLEALTHQVSGGGSASSWLSQVESAVAAFGGSGGFDGHAQDMGMFVDARKTKAAEVLSKAGGGVSTAVALLERTIQRYENHEKATKQAADNTPAGQGSSGSAGGPAGGRGV